MLNIKAVDKIYYNLINDNDYGDFPETLEGRRKLKAYLTENYLSEDDEKAFSQWLEAERFFGGYAMINERQGFIYGFNYAAELFAEKRESYNTGIWDKVIKNEFSTLVVEWIDKTDQFIDMLKKCIPQKKYDKLADVFCSCLDETKFAVFEQGFLRGIAAIKSGAEYGR